MCDFVNVFVPAERVVESSTPRLSLWSGGEVQRDFASRLASASIRGSIFSVVTGQSCLCGFNDWPALYELGRALLRDNRVESVSMLWFGSSWRGTLSERMVD